MRYVRGSQRSAGFSLRMVLSVIFVLAILSAWTVYHAYFVVGRSLTLAFPDWGTSFRSATPKLFGGAVAKDVTLVPPDGDQAGTVRFATLDVDVPFFEYYTSALSHRRGTLLKSIDTLRLQLKDGHGSLNEPFTNELAAFGNFTAAPFEAEGCVDDAIWRQNEVSDMGLSTRGVELTLAFDAHGSRLLKQQSLAIAGVGRVEVRRELVEPADFSLFNPADSGVNDVALDEWRVKDEGFVAARNRHCALTDHVSEPEFVDRHIASVKRLLESVGLAVSPEIVDAYRIYATQGGGFDMSVRYDPPLVLTKDAVKQVEELLPRVQAKFTVAGKVHAVALRGVMAKPLPETDKPLSTYAVVQRESGATGASGDDEIRFTVNAPRKKTPALAPPVAVVPAPSLVPDSDAEGAITDYKELGNYIGRYITVHQQGQPVGRVEVLRLVEDGVLVRRHLTGGNVDYVLDRKRFEYARL